MYGISIRKTASSYNLFKSSAVKGFNTIQSILNIGLHPSTGITEAENALRNAKHSLNESAHTFSAEQTAVLQQKIKDLESALKAKASGAASAAASSAETALPVSREIVPRSVDSIVVRDSGSAAASAESAASKAGMPKGRTAAVIGTFVGALLGTTAALSKIWASGNTIYQNAINARTVLEQTGSLKSVIEPADYSSLINLFQAQSALGNAMRGLQSQFNKLRSYDMTSASPESFDKDMVALEILLASFRDKRKQYNQIAGQNYLEGFASKYGIKRTIDPRNLMAIQDIKSQGGRANQQIKESLRQIESANFEQEVDSILARYKQLKPASTTPATPPAPRPRRPTAPRRTPSPQPKKPPEVIESPRASESGEDPDFANINDKTVRAILTDAKSLKKKIKTYEENVKDNPQASIKIKNILRGVNILIGMIRNHRGEADGIFKFQTGLGALQTMLRKFVTEFNLT